MHQAIIRAYPDSAFFNRRFHNSKNGAVVLDAGVVFGYWSSGRSLFGFIVSREISADLLPALSFIGRFEEHIRRGVKGIRVMRRKDDWKIPLETVFQIRSAPAHRVIRPRIHIALLAGVAILARYQPAIGTGVYDLRIFRTWSNPSALSAADVVPVGAIDASLSSSAWDSKSRVALLRSIDGIRKVIVQRHALKLCCWLVLDRAPALPAIKADLGSAIITNDGSHRIIRS